MTTKKFFQHIHKISNKISTIVTVFYKLNQEFP
jgi:hypothetical protein